MSASTCVRADRANKLRISFGVAPLARVTSNTILTDLAAFAPIIITSVELRLRTTPSGTSMTWTGSAISLCRLEFNRISRILRPCREPKATCPSANCSPAPTGSPLKQNNCESRRPFATCRTCSSVKRAVIRVVVFRKYFIENIQVAKTRRIHLWSQASGQCVNDFTLRIRSLFFRLRHESTSQLGLIALLSISTGPIPISI